MTIDQQLFTIKTNDTPKLLRQVSYQPNNQIRTNHYLRLVAQGVCIGLLACSGGALAGAAQDLVTGDGISFFMELK